MKARPILFSGPMVRALLDGRKTQTRRTVKPQPWPAKESILRVPGMYLDDWVWSYPDSSSCYTVSNRENGPENYAKYCPYGQTGDLLWVRESFSYDRLDVDRNGFMPPWHWADGSPADGDFTKPKPSIHMPRWASRLTLEITGVRVERLQAISEADAIAEGIEPVFTGAGEQCGWLNYEHTGDGVGYCTSPVDSYATLWRHINGPDAWNYNPWVWIPAFRVHKQNVDVFLTTKGAA
jgi:hypothetical protein